MSCKHKHHDPRKLMDVANKKAEGVKAPKKAEPDRGKTQGKPRK